MWRVVCCVEGVQCVEGSMLCGGWYSVWRVVCCVEGGTVCGGWYSMWRVVQCVEGGTMCGGWYSVWRVVQCVEGGTVCGGWYAVWNYVCMYHTKVGKCSYVILRRLRCTPLAASPAEVKCSQDPTHT